MMKAFEAIVPSRWKNPPGPIEPTTIVSQSPLVLTSDQNGLTILLALPTSTYYTLDEVGSVVWKSLEGGAPCAGAVDAVVAATGGGPQVEAEVLDFVRQLEMQQLLVRGYGTVRDSDPSRQPAEAAWQGGELPSVCGAVWRLALLSWSLRILGVHRLLRLLRLQPGHLSVGRDDMSHLARHVAYASTWCPFRSECLEQSVFLLWFLRGRGVRAELCLGVLQYPFKAHAWVEVDGIPVNEHADRISHYRRFRLDESLGLELCSPS
jgi:hypothetical protein